MAAVVYDEPRSSGWLRDQRFDLIFIVGLTALALVSGVAVLLEPRLLMPILLTDLWLLGYHHVISTYTRLCFDKQSLQRYGFLVFGLPFMVAAASLGAVYAASGVWIIVSIYFYWQWFHYTRQSWGISQAYRRKADRNIPPASHFDGLVFWAYPIAGILNRSTADVDSFLGMPIRMIAVPSAVANAALFVAGALVAAWTVRAALQYRRNRLAVSIPHLLYQLSHQAIFLVAYVLISDITVGWLVVNIWHNAQYVLFVWIFNNRRFSGGVSAKAPLLSRLSQNGRIFRYLGFCLLLSTTVYLLLATVVPLILVLPVFLIYHVINFHHYVVDSIVWRSTHVKRALQAD